MLCRCSQKEKSITLSLVSRRKAPPSSPRLTTKTLRVARTWLRTNASRRPRRSQMSASNSLMTRRPRICHLTRKSIWAKTLKIPLSRISNNLSSDHYLLSFNIILKYQVNCINLLINSNSDTRFGLFYNEFIK